MMYGTPIIDAHAMPSPIIGRNSAYRLPMWAKAYRPMKAQSRAPTCTHLAPYRRARPTSQNATQKVTTLSAPLTSPVQATAWE